MGSTSERMRVETVPGDGTVPAGMVPLEPRVAALLADVVRAWAVLDGTGRGKVLHYAPALGAALARLTPEALSAAAHADRLDAINLNLGAPA